MREIKFRAWGKFGHRKEEKENHMVYEWEDTTYIECTSFNGGDYFDVMQYTGLKDKNGKEIYEGDVVYLAGYGDYLVEWPFIDLYQSAFELDVGAIKGNIHENPELLET
jgi:uncharacterized phage protein (TIGR01671 family)